MIKTLKIHDKWLFWLGCVATCLGLLFIFDAGYARAIQNHKSGLPPEFQSQLAFLLLAGAATWWAGRVPSEAWKKWSKLAWLINFSLLLAVLAFGHEMNGARRWLGVGSYGIQPGEFAKLAAVIYLAGYFAERRAWPKKIKAPRTFALRVDNIWIPKLKRCMPAIWVFLAVCLVEIEPDMGTGAVIAATGFAMFIPAGVTWKSISVALAVAGVAGGIAVMKEPYRLQRFTHHSQRWTDENFDNLEFQSDQSELAMASGGIGGVGLGAGRAKQVLPATTTDFISATIAEEFGLWGSLVVLGVLGAIVFRLLYLARQANTRFGMLVLCGVGFWIGIQTCVNVMMANAFLPAIGIPLPFISSGGSSLVALWMALGVCQSALGASPPPPIEPPTKAAKPIGEPRPAHRRSEPRVPVATSLSRLKVTSGAKGRQTQGRAGRM